MILLKIENLGFLFYTGFRGFLISCVSILKSYLIFSCYTYNQDSATWIKRVIAGPGDTVSYEDGYLLVNGTSKETAEWSGKTTKAGDQTYPIALSDNEYFVIGDIH